METSAINQKRAREIMGRNFFGVEEAIKYFGVNPTSEQLSALSEIPFSEAVLEQARDTHVLVAVFPLSIFDIRGKEKNKFFAGQDSDHLYSKGAEKSIIEERGEASWQLVRKTPVENSISKDWREQRVLIGKDDEIPTARVMIYTIIGYYLATGERLFENVLIRTSSYMDFGGYCGSYPVVIGHFNQAGLRFDGSTRALNNVGLASAKKF